MANNPVVQEIKAELLRPHGSICRARTDTTQVLAGNPSLETMSNEESNWQMVADKLTLWQNDLTARIASLESREARLQQQWTTWQQISAAAGSANLPPEVLEKVKNTIADITATRGHVAENQSDVLGLQAAGGSARDQGGHSQRKHWKRRANNCSNSCLSEIHPHSGTSNSKTPHPKQSRQ